MKTVLAVAALVCSGAAFACADSLGAGAVTVADAHGRIALRSVPNPVVVGRHFVLDVVSCPAVQAMRVDAHMPEHRHGMNYTASVAPRGGGAFRAEGLLLHMPGRWELVFELQSADGRWRRLVHSLNVD